MQQRRSKSNSLTLPRLLAGVSVVPLCGLVRQKSVHLLEPGRHFLPSLLLPKQKVVY